MTTLVSPTSATTPLGDRSRMLFSSGRWCFEAAAGEDLTPVFAPDPTGVARDVMDRLRTADEVTGRTHVVCGLIPFDLREPSFLTLTDQARFFSRQVHHADGDSTVASGSATSQRGALRVPDSAAYRAQVRRALEHIAAGEIEKIVLARTMDVPLPARTDARGLSGLLAERLALADPTADVYCVEGPDEALWVGASPEVVADVRQGRFLTHPLAGSMRGDVPQEEALAILQASRKDRREHAHVVEHIEAALGPLTESRHVPSRPSLFATDAMWHLGTRITGQLSAGVSALEAALALHPTPAVCGTPTEVAADLIPRLEGRPRHFYAGLVGWSDASGDGRWSLVLRGARVTSHDVRLHAGAGIVAGSDPAAEHEETAAKFATVLRALEGLS